MATASTNLAAEVAAMAADFYSAMISQEIPAPGPGGPTHFTPAQAFELTRLFLYESLKESDLV